MLRKNLWLILGICLWVVTLYWPGTGEKGLAHKEEEKREGELATAGAILSETLKEEIDYLEEEYKIVRVVDGDTVVAEIDGQEEVIRLIGLDTPETKDPRGPVECYGEEASKKTEEVLLGKMVRLEADEATGERDKYDRLLRYIWLPGGINFNEYLIREGYAHEYTYDAIYKYQGSFREAERVARENKRGLWHPEACQNWPASAISIKPKSKLESELVNLTGSVICDYNAYNCSNFKKQAEAQAVFAACGGSDNDIHKLDADRDGKVCETLP